MTVQVRVQRDGPVTSTVRSDDSIRSYIDGVVKIVGHRRHSYGTRSIIPQLGEGF